MIKLIDYILYKIVEFFKRKHLFFVWFVSYNVVGLGFYQYEISNGYEPKLYWYDAVTIIVFVSTYLRAKLIVDELESNKD